MKTEVLILNHHVFTDIDQYPPHTLFADELLREAFWTTIPWLTISRPEEGHGSTGHSVGEYDCSAQPGGVCFYNSVVTLTGTNRTVIYRIGDYQPERRAWEASWPD